MVEKLFVLTSLQNDNCLLRVGKPAKFIVTEWIVSKLVTVVLLVQLVVLTRSL